MDIKYFGHAAFYIKTKNTRIVMDPFDPYIGLKFPKTEADIVTVSHHHKDHNNVAAITGNPLVIDMPGEFEKGGVRITGYLSYHDKEKGAQRGEDVLYKLETEEGITVLHCGDLGIIPEENFLESIDDIDILFVPVGGFFTIDAVEAEQLIKKIEPSIVIPMHYGSPQLKPDLGSKLAPVADFLKKFGAEAVKPVPKLTVKKDEMEQEMKVVPMEISS